MSAQTFGNYQLVKKLATGGMAEVWLAKQTGIEGFNRHVVVKRILPHLAEDPEFVQMFLNEAKIASRFNHPNIAQIYDLGEKDGQYYIAMEFIHGEDLGRVMRRAWSTGQWVARHIALRIVSDACAGLYYAHTRNDDNGRPLLVVHRDISPQNILISFDGAVKVVDFGIAKASDQVSNTKSGAIKGKFAYMAPEQAAGKPLDARSDLFALGLVLYELVTGVRPLKRDSELATLQAALEGRIDPPSAVAEVPGELDDVVMRALAKAPDDRYADAREFQRALESFLLNSRELSTSAEVSELMSALFADRLSEEARLGTPNPATESSVNNPAAASWGSAAPASVTVPPPRSQAPSQVRASPAMTLEQEDSQVGQPDDEPSVSVGGGYELPPGTVVPSRAYGGRRGTRVPAADTSADLGPPVPSAPRRRATSVPPSALQDEDNPPLVNSSGRRPSAQLRRRSSSAGLSMPEAPPRKSRNELGAQQRASDAALDQLIDVKALRARQQSRLKAVVAVVMLLGVVAGIVLFKDQLLGLLNQTGMTTDGTPVRLTVMSNPKATNVIIVPGPGSRGRSPIDLGPSVNEQSGAFVGDTVILRNTAMGLEYPVVIGANEPNALVTISETFNQVIVKITVKPALRDAQVYRARDNSLVGQASMAFKLYPGTHQLTLQSNSLDEPFPFEVLVSNNVPSLNPVVDVSAALKKK